MRQPGEFEGYADRFAVSESELIDRGLREEDEFTAWMAEVGGALQTYAIAYVVPFTVDLRPTVLLTVVERMTASDFGDRPEAGICLQRGVRLIGWGPARTVASTGACFSPIFDG